MGRIKVGSFGSMGDFGSRTRSPFAARLRYLGLKAPPFVREGMNAFFMRIANGIGPLSPPNQCYQVPESMTIFYRWKCWQVFSNRGHRGYHLRVGTLTTLFAQAVRVLPSFHPSEYLPLHRFVDKGKKSEPTGILSNVQVVEEETPKQANHIDVNIIPG